MHVPKELLHRIYLLEHHPALIVHTVAVLHLHRLTFLILAHPNHSTSFLPL